MRKCITDDYECICKAGHSGVPCYICLCVWAIYGCVGYFTFLFFLLLKKLVCYAHIYFHVSCYICLFVWAMVGWVTSSFFLLSFYFLKKLHVAMHMFPCILCHSPLTPMGFSLCRGMSTTGEGGRGGASWTAAHTIHGTQT